MELKKNGLRMRVRNVCDVKLLMKEDINTWRLD